MKKGRSGERQRQLKKNRGMKHNTKTQKPESREEKERKRERSEKNFKKKSIERDTQNAREDWPPPLRFSGRRKKGKKEGKNEEGKKEVANNHMTCV